jgi:hypothetical protein
VTAKLVVLAYQILLWFWSREELRVDQNSTVTCGSLRITKRHESDNPARAWPYVVEDIVLLRGVCLAGRGTAMWHAKRAFCAKPAAAQQVSRRLVAASCPACPR